MKPIRLSMVNIGPYRNETVDFSALDNMFLIKGETGSGKTFIFDAITFALYGELRGNRKGHESSFKSRYALESDEAFVDFTFEIYGKKYRIYRTVPFSYTNRNGKNAKKVSETALWVWKNDGFENISGKTSEINEKIRGIIGLSVDEFAQIVLLPQGEFAKFLKQNTSERADTLKKLFPVDFYSEITTKIQEKTKFAEEQLKNYDNLILTLSDGKDFSNAGEKISLLESEIDVLKKNDLRFRSEQTELTKKIENLKNEKEIAREFEENVRNLKILEEKAADFKALEKTIHDADKAKSLRVFIISIEEKEHNIKATQKELDDDNKAYENCKAHFDFLDSQKVQMNDLQNQNENDALTLSVLREKIQKAQNLNDLLEKNNEALRKKQDYEGQKHEISVKICDIQKQYDGKISVQLLNDISACVQNLTEKKNLLEDELSECSRRDGLMEKIADNNLKLSVTRKNLNDEEEKLVRAKQTLDELEQKQKEEEQKNSAYSLSLFLKSGMACPVCGSVNHPSPAKKSGDLTSFPELIETQKGLIKSVQSNLEHLKKEEGSFSAVIKGYDEQLSEIKSSRELEVVQEELDCVKKEIDATVTKKSKINDDFEQLENLSNSLNRIEEKLNLANQDYTESKIMVDELQKNLGEPYEILVEKEKKLSAALEDGRLRFNQWNEDFNKCKVDLATIHSKIEKGSKDLQNFNVQLEQSVENFKLQLAKTDFDCMESAKAAYLEDEKLSELRNNLNEYNEKRRSVSDAVKNGQSKNLKKYDVLCGELDFVQKAADEIEQKYKENNSLFIQKQNELHDYKNDFEKIQSAQNSKLALEKELLPLKALNDNISGKNPQKLQLEAWALGMYFEDVVDYASRRFSDLSDGRFKFELKKSDDVSHSGNSYRGLDLLVVDTHTNKTSDAAELSGGETFEASISLALAITDVVQRNNGGGIQLDSLFIDEGFGTLDPETLEKAMTVLTELGATKMIGIISHVSEMEQFCGITSALEIIKEKDGSHIKPQI